MFVVEGIKLLMMGNILIAALFSSSSFAMEEINWKSFLSGAFTTFVVHEAGHFFAAQKYDFDIDYQNLSIHYPDSADPRKQLRTSSVGFQTQWLASEYAFNKLEKNKLSIKPKPMDFYKGMIAGHVAISLANIILLNDEQSDVYNIADVTSLTNDQVLAMILIPAGLDAARLWMDNPPKWLKTASISTKGLYVTAVWTF